MEALYYAYSTDGKDINSKAVLMEVVRGTQSLAQMASVLEAKLNSNEGRDQVFREDQVIKSRNITSVPHFFIKSEDTGKTMSISGDQPPNGFLEVFESVCQLQIA